MAKKSSKSRSLNKRLTKKRSSDSGIARLAKLSQAPRFKTIAIGAISALALPLLAYFVFSSNVDAQYVCVLVYISLCILVWSLPRIELGLTGVFLFVQPLLFYLGNTEYSYTKAAFSILSISLLGLVWIGSWFRDREARIQLTRLIWPGLAIIVVALLSLINSAAFLADFQYVVLILYFVFFYLFIANLFEHDSQIKFALRVLLFCGFLAGLYALMQYFGVLIGTPGSPNGTAAVISTFGNKNYLAGFLAYLFVPGLILFFKPEKSWDRLYSMGMLVFFTISLLACTSESAWFALLLALGVGKLGLLLSGESDVIERNWRWGLLFSGVLFAGVLLFLMLHALIIGSGSVSLGGLFGAVRAFSMLAWLVILGLLLLPVSSGLIWLFRSPHRRALWIGVAVIFLLLLGSIFTPIGQSAAARLADFIQDSTVETRSQDWLIGLEMFYDNPIIGAGLGDYKREFLNYKAEFLASPIGEGYHSYIRRAAQAHNEYVQILAEMGILGILAVLTLIVMIGWTAWQRLRAASSEARWSIALIFAGVAAFMADAIFSFPLHLPANALLLVFLLGVLQSRALGPPAVEVRLSVRAVAAISVIAVVVVGVVMTFSYRDWIANISLDLGKISYQAKGDAEAAEELMERSIELSIDPSEAYYWLAQLRYDEALRGLSQPNLALEERIDLVDSAIESFERSLPGFATENTLFYLGVLYQSKASLLQDQSYWDIALHYADRLAAIDPAPDIFHDLMQLRGIIMFNRGEELQGITQLEELTVSHPNRPHIRSTLSKMYLEMMTNAESGAESDNWCRKAKFSLEEAVRLTERRIDRLEDILQSEAMSVVKTFRWQSELDSLEIMRASSLELLRSISC